MTHDMLCTLLSLGYRQLSSTEAIWAKPFGFSLITMDCRYVIEKNIIIIKQIFQAANNKDILVWDSLELNITGENNIIDKYGSLENAIMFFENYQVKTGITYNNKSWAFLSQFEKFSNLL